MRVLVLSLVALVGCRASSSPPVPRSSAQTKPVADGGGDREARVAPAAATPSDEGTVTAQPDASAHPQQETKPEDVLPHVCAVSWLVAPDGSREMGCRTHPPWTAQEQLPDGKVPVHRGDAPSICTLERIFSGSFSRLGAKQHVLAFNSCWETPSGYKTNFANAFSTVLVEEGEHGWKSLAYDEIVTSGCQLGRRADGRDLLFCEGGFAASSNGMLGWAFIMDYARPQHAGTAAYFWSNLETFICRNAEVASTEVGGIVGVKRRSATVRDVNGDGTDDFVLELDRTRVPPSPKLAAAIASCHDGGAPDALTAMIPPPTKATIEIVSSENTFVLPEASYKTLKKWERESPPRFAGFIETAPPPIWRK